MDIEHDQNVDSRSAELAVRASLPVLETRMMDAAKYKAIVSKYDGVLAVSFIDKNSEKISVRGNPGLIPGLGVYVYPQNLKVKSSNFIR